MLDRADVFKQGDVATTDWKRKLSRWKFWTLLATLVTSLLTALGASNDTVIQVTGVIGTFGAVIAYILAETYVDAKAIIDDVEVDKT
ncbi:hypothetical protein ASL14_19320 [Paenibacillus sp. IHB B 3084]|uniref:hypothetical protein n=1 Tax=Paenibacillus sp. IHB B 3084 TaxID=867076 RepID=UPI000722140F|nr:hypothetical protein [Paenibacillus sp. IHB B 3084]ALP38019.1 hypothetical protein ASL14_19320 [Paenibacillus sp. IHB B 3084]